MPGYGNPVSDPLTFGLSAGGASGANFGPPTWQSQFNYGRPAGTRMTPTAAAGQGNKFNLGSATDIKNISDIINQINLSATKAAQAARIPGEAGLEAKSSANIGQELAGQVPQDVENLLAQQAAERGIGGGGTASSPNANAAYLRALGLTSIGQEQIGQQNLTAAEGRNPQAPITNPAQFTLTPAQAAQLQLGYQTEADRVAEESARLALEAGRGGGSRGGGGYGYGGLDTGTGSPYEYAAPGTYAYGAPSTTTLSSGQPTLNPGFSQADWLKSLGNYSANLEPDTGLPLSTVDYSGFGQGGEE